MDNTTENHIFVTLTEDVVITGEVEYPRETGIMLPRMGTSHWSSWHGAFPHPNEDEDALLPLPWRIDSVTNRLYVEDAIAYVGGIQDTLDASTPLLHAPHPRLETAKQLLPLLERTIGLPVCTDSFGQVCHRGQQKEQLCLLCALRDETNRCEQQTRQLRRDGDSDWQWWEDRHYLCEEIEQLLIYNDQERSIHPCDYCGGPGFHHNGSSVSPFSWRRGFCSNYCFDLDSITHRLHLKKELQELDIMERWVLAQETSQGKLTHRERQKLLREIRKLKEETKDLASFWGVSAEGVS